ncbi:MAG: hypothetical protein KF812_11230 [Fimbriimonadaceae bacterium]|nr:hypothetical protein [Fimbriimonadaceae bacterium]
MFAPLALVLLTLPPEAELDRHLYPFSAPIACPEITLDTTAAEDMKPWAERAKTLAEQWFPHICELLSTAEYKAPAKINFVFRVGQSAPAYASGSEISFSADWIRQHPDDFGMVVHELTHIVQAYPRNRFDTGWLTEGIADYVRWWRFEPEFIQRPINFQTASYRDAYRTTAAFLAWSSKKYNSALVPALDLNLRKAEDPMPTFQRLTGKTAEELWEEFKKATGPAPAAGGQ